MAEPCIGWAAPASLLQSQHRGQSYAMNLLSRRQYIDGRVLRQRSEHHAIGFQSFESRYVFEHDLQLELAIQEVADARSYHDHDRNIGGRCFDSFVKAYAGCRAATDAKVPAELETISPSFDSSEIPCMSLTFAAILSLRLTLLQTRRNPRRPLSVS